MLSYGRVGTSLTDADPAMRSLRIAVIEDCVDVAIRCGRSSGFANTGSTDW